MCGSRKYLYPPLKPWDVYCRFQGRWVSTAKTLVLKGKNKPKLEFLGGSNSKTL